MKTESSFPYSRDSARLETDSVHILVHYLFIFHFNIILPSAHTSRVISFPTKIFYVFHMFRPSFIPLFDPHNNICYWAIWLKL